MGTYLQTSSGKKIDFDDIRQENFNLDDIIYSLALLCRYNGHIKHFYSVLAHEINCYYIGKYLNYSQEELLYCLLHDSTEAYIGDIASPIKERFSGIRDFEDEIYSYILKALNLDFPSEEILKKVKLTDKIALHKEWKALMDEDFESEYTLYDVESFSTDEEPVEETRNRYRKLINSIIKEGRNEL